jgi:hypothetical protein
VAERIGRKKNKSTGNWKQDGQKVASSPECNHSRRDGASPNESSEVGGAAEEQAQQHVHAEPVATHPRAASNARETPSTGVESFPTHSD